MNLGGLFQIGGEAVPACEGLLGPHSPALMHLKIIELDLACHNIHRLCARGIGLEGHGQERLVVYEQEELVPVHSVVQRHLPV